MTRGVRYVVPLVLLMLSSAGICVCVWGMLYCDTPWVRLLGVVGVVDWLIVLCAGVAAIHKGYWLPSN